MVNVNYMNSYLFEIDNNQNSEVALDVINERLKKINNIYYGVYSLKKRSNRFRLQMSRDIETGTDLFIDYERIKGRMLTELFRDYGKIRYKILEDISAKGKIGFLFKDGGVFICLSFYKQQSFNILKNKLLISEDSIIQQANSGVNTTDYYLWLSYNDLSESDCSYKGIINSSFAPLKRRRTS